MNAELERLVSSLLYEGYALYPYTPSTAKNATPTPFGIVYPPAYAEGSSVTFDHLRVEGIVIADDPEQRVGADVRFLQASGERHQAAERTLGLGPATLAELEGEGVGDEFSHGEPAISGRARLRAERLSGSLWRMRCCVHNSTPVAGGLDRGAALRASLVSTHVVLEAPGARFASPLERDGEVGAAVDACESVNTFPVLAAPDDSALLAATIVLPDHPKIAPQSLGNLFDNTEIEEALLLHVQALSDDEREQIAGHDPAVREMVERAAGAAPDDVLALHGLMTPSAALPSDPGPEPEPGHPNPGEAMLEHNGTTLRKGAKVLLRPGTDRDVYDRMLDGRTATIERLYLDYDDGAHVAVTIDDDPGQELFRETGRYLFFKPSEVEALR